jgi:NAD(P)-dependent dehydrogenase (short-subunit alcohol dehydrogenase family)
VAVTDDGWGDDGWGVADELITLLHDAGAVAKRWDGASADGIGVLIFLGGLRPDEDDAAVAFEAFHAARALGGRGSFVTVGRSGRAGPGALARSCAREWPGPEAAVRTVELEYEGDDATVVAAAVATELLTGDTVADVVVRADGSRASWAMIPSPLRTSQQVGAAAPIRPESVIVISGGGRGVTAACARALARAFRPRIGLIGRTPLTEEMSEPPEIRAARTDAALRAALLARARSAGERPRPSAIEAELKRILGARELRETLADIEAAGSPVRYIAADVAEADSLETALREVRDAWGPVTGLVHGAGVLADRLIADKTDEQFEQVMRVKVRGFQNLLDLLAADDPELVCAFSSVVVSAGNAGQCDYAAANEIVERMALDWRSRHPRCLVKAIAWGPWSGGMVSPELAVAFEERNIPLIPLAEGAAAFVEELTGPADHVRCLITADGGDSRVPAAAGHGSFGDEKVRRDGEIAVNEVAHAWLADHQIAGRAVVPLAVGMDWMLRLADDPAAVLRDIQVVRPVTAPATVTVRRSGSALTVATEAGVGPCYLAVLAAGSETAILSPLPDPAGLGPSRRDPIYDGEVLFQGPSLRVLRRIEGIGATGAVGEVVGAGEAEWPDERWRTDPAALDGAIQLAVDWAHERTGCAMLPMSVREARFRPAGLESGPLRCVVRAVSAHEHSAVCDVSLTGPDGLIVAALDGLELVARPR